ncbi:hypothetical protein P3574_24710, partial [Vibrio parahaemolyticus]|nr:hypothetical protein [Vibrio parahaemolyticus]
GDLFAHRWLPWQGRVATSLIFGFPADRSSKSGFSAANAAAGIQLRRLLRLCTGTLLMLLAVLL